MLKLSFSKPSVRTYKEGRITVCRYDCTLLDSDSKKVVLDFKVSGTAVCSPEDEVDEAIGRRLADSRAKLIAYRTASNMLTSEDIVGIIDEILAKTDIVRFWNSMKHLKKQEVEHIKFLCEDVK